jgi:hypothetical protein
MVGQNLWKRIQRKIVHSLIVSITTSLFLVPGIVQPAFADEVPQTLGYQGRLKNASGTVLSGSYTFTFRLYTASSGGSVIWTETQPGVTVDQGAFAVQLGSVTPLPVRLIFQNRYI